MPVAPGTRLGPYEVLARIGEGGMGVVYRALDPRLDRQVAIKVLPADSAADQQARERLRNEAMAAAALDHPYICKIFEIGEYGESLFLVMEYIAGETLDCRLRHGRMPLPETLRLAGEIAEALQEAHERGILHRDLKPSNIMLTQQGHVKIMDFGLAKRLAYLPRADDATVDIASPQLTAPGTILGTPDYMSPEQVKGLPLDIRSDLFSFGVVLAEMAGARHPFRKKSTVETFSAVLCDPPDLNSDMPAGVTVLLQRLLAKSAEDRYGSAAEVRASLTGQTSSLRPERVSKIIDSLAVLPFRQLAEAEHPATAATPVVETRPIDQRLSARPRFLVTILVSCFAVALAMIVYLGWRRMRAGPFPSSGYVMLAVLPFQNLSGDPSQDYFSDGLTEEMIAQLGALSPDQLGVIARTTTMAYKHTSKSVEQIGSELGVGYVLESSVRRDGDQVRISVQLIRAHDQVPVWTRSYDRHISHSIELQEEVAKAVAEQIEVKLSPTYKGRTNPHPLDAEANEAYLRGRYFWNQFTPEGYRKAITYFQKAIERDSNFAEAYSGLADSYNFLVLTDSMPTSDVKSEGLEAARRAVALGDNLAESHTSLALALGRSEWNWSGTVNELKRAIALNPSYSMAHRIYAANLATAGRHHEALQEINEAMRLDPLSLPNNAEVIRTLYYARNYDQAIVQGQKAMQLDPNYARTHFWLGRVYSQKGMHREAILASEKILETMPDSNLGLTEMAYTLAAAGRQSEARKILRRLEDRSEHAFVPAYNLAIIHIALNEEEVAMRYMRQAFEDHDWALVVLAVEPRVDPMRRDPRFQEILAKLNLQ